MIQLYNTKQNKESAEDEILLETERRQSASRNLEVLILGREDVVGTLAQAGEHGQNNIV